MPVPAGGGNLDLVFVEQPAAERAQIAGRDRQDGEEVYSSGRHQIWLVPGLHYQVIPATMRLQLFGELPLYQHFCGEQLGSDFNLRFSASFSIPFAGEETFEEE